MVKVKRIVHLQDKNIAEDDVSAVAAKAAAEVAAAAAAALMAKTAAAVAAAVAVILLRPPRRSWVAWARSQTAKAGMRRHRKTRERTRMGRKSEGE